MEFRTAEEKLLADYTELERENEGLRDRIADLENPERDPAVYRIDHPIELACAYVGFYWTRRDDTGKLTADQLREMCSTREGLIELANMHSGRNENIRIIKRVFPYRISMLGLEFALDVAGIDDLYVVKVCDVSDLNPDHWYPIECSDALYEVALEKLKKNVLERAISMERYQ